MRISDWSSDVCSSDLPSKETMKTAIQLAIRDSGLPAEVIGYVNAHGTATDVGDVAESHATEGALGRPVPISYLTCYMGHTLGACGSLEAWSSDERRVGTECGRTCRSRWSPCHSKKNKKLRLE